MADTNSSTQALWRTAHVGVGRDTGPTPLDGLKPRPAPQHSCDLGAGLRVASPQPHTPSRLSTHCFNRDHHVFFKNISSRLVSLRRRGNCAAMFQKMFMTSLDGESPPQRAAGVRAGALREPYRPVVRGGAPGNLSFHLRRPRSRLRPGSPRRGAAGGATQGAHLQ